MRDSSYLEAVNNNDMETAQRLVDEADDYGVNVRAYYLNISDPADEKTGYNCFKKYKGQNGAGIKAREDLESMGYEGVNNEDEEYIAFNSEQIKSADPVTYDDKGNVIPLSERFKDDNKDIRYSVDDVITQKDIDILRTIGRKSINEFTSDDINKTEKWARKFHKELNIKSPFFRAWFGDWRAFDTKSLIKIDKVDLAQITDINKFIKKSMS